MPLCESSSSSFFDCQETIKTFFLFFNFKQIKSDFALLFIVREGNRGLSKFCTCYECRQSTTVRGKATSTDQSPLPCLSTNDQLSLKTKSEIHASFFLSRFTTLVS